MAARALCMILLSMLFFSMSIQPVFAENRGIELENDIKQFQIEQKKKEQEAESTAENIGEAAEAASIIQQEIRELDEEMAETNHSISLQQKDIEMTNEETLQLRESIVEMEKRISDREEVLQERVKSMHQRSGTIQYMEVILGSQSFGDLLARVSALRNIAQQDRTVLDAHISDMEALETARLSLGEELHLLETQMSELEIMQLALEEAAAEKALLLEDAEERGYILEDYLLSIEEEQTLLQAQTEAAALELTAWEEEQARLEQERVQQEERLAALEKEQQAAEEAALAKKEQAAQEETELKQEQNTEQQAEQETELETEQTASENEILSPGEPADAGSVEESDAPDLSEEVSSVSEDEDGSLFNRPADGRITSPYDQNRLHPIHKTVRPHNGIDFGRDGGLNIYAAEAGTVFSSGWRNGLGNTIMLSHNINGKEYTTLYGHLAEMNVSPGDRVERGEIIAVMGTTGVSTGVHLHFEVHPGGYSGGESAVDPAPYLP